MDILGSQPTISTDLSPATRKTGWFKRHKFLTFFLILPVLLIVLAVALYFSVPRILSLTNGADDPPPSDQDFAWSTVNLPDQQNAYFDLLKISNSEVYEPEGFNSLDIVEGKSWNQPLIESVLKQNELILEYFTDAAAKSAYQNPNLADMSKYNIDTVQIPKNTWRNASRLNVIKAELFSRQGLPNEANTEAMKSVKVGHMIMESQVDMIEYLVGKLIKEDGLEMLQQNLRYKQFTNEELQSLQNELSQYPVTNKGLINSFKVEYKFNDVTITEIASDVSSTTHFQSGSLLEAYKNQSKNNYLFKPNQTKQLFADYFRKNIVAAEQQECSVAPTNKTLDDGTAENMLKLPFIENAVGKIIFDITHVDWTTLHSRACQQRVLYAITQTTIALKSYANDHNGQYPQGLEELVPTYLAQVPMDPFDGSPIKYSQSKSILYSISRDLVDANGDNTGGSSWSTMNDLVFHFK